MKVRLDLLDANARNYHFAVIDITEEDDQEVEQALLDERDDRIVETTARIEKLFALPKVKLTVLHIDPRSTLHKRLQRVGNNVQLVADEILPMKPGHKVDVCLIQQLER